MTDRDFCQFAHPIYINHLDTLSLDTQREILAHDQTGQYLCDWQPAK